MAAFEKLAVPRRFITDFPPVKSKLCSVRFIVQGNKNIGQVKLSVCCGINHSFTVFNLSVNDDSLRKNVSHANEQTSSVKNMHRVFLSKINFYLTASVGGRTTEM